MKDERCCGNCMWYELNAWHDEDFNEWVCVNSDSKNYNENMREQDCCPEWDS